MEYVVGAQKGMHPQDVFIGALRFLLRCADVQCTYLRSCNRTTPGGATPLYVFGTQLHLPKPCCRRKREGGGRKYTIAFGTNLLVKVLLASQCQCGFGHARNRHCFLQRFQVPFELTPPSISAHLMLHETAKIPLQGRVTTGIFQSRSTFARSDRMCAKGPLATTCVFLIR